MQTFLTAEPDTRVCPPLPAALPITEMPALGRGQTVRLTWCRHAGSARMNVRVHQTERQRPAAICWACGNCECALSDRESEQ